VSRTGKKLIYVGSSLKDLGKFPTDVQDVMVTALNLAKVGDKHQDAKPLKGFKGSGVLEMVDDDDGDTYRAVYTVRLSQAVYVLHAFKKKSTTGVKTSRRDIDLVKQRLTAAETYDAALKAQVTKARKEDEGGDPR